MASPTALAVGKIPDGGRRRQCSAKAFIVDAALAVDSTKLLTVELTYRRHLPSENPNFFVVVVVEGVVTQQLAPCVERSHHQDVFHMVRH